MKGKFPLIKNRGFVQFLCFPGEDLVGACTYPGNAKIEAAFIEVPFYCRGGSHAHVSSVAGLTI